MDLRLASTRVPVAVRPMWLRAMFAIACVLFGWLAREALTPAIGPTADPFIFFFPAVAAAAWFGGFVPGALALVLATFAANWFFLEPFRSLAIDGTKDISSLLAFLGACAVIIAA